MDYSPRGRKESDTTEQLSPHKHTHTHRKEQGDSVSILGRIVKVIFAKRFETHEKVSHGNIWEKSFSSSAKALPVPNL